MFPECCPACACDLTARPPPNVCPDCGFEYDEHTRIWQSGETWVRLASVYTAGGLLIGVFVSVVYRASLDRAPYPELPLVLGLIAPVVGLLFRRLISGRITGRFVALTPRGVVVGTRPEPILVPWDDVERIQEHRGVLKLQSRTGGPPLNLDDIFASPAETTCFREELHAALRSQRRQSAAPRPP